VAAAQKFWVDRGVWVRPFRNLIYVMPPYVISDGQLDRLTGAIEAWVTR
jgi:adenosylmethionine---8-amino-7-oxononanoate aminotransferase